MAKIGVQPGQRWLLNGQFLLLLLLLRSFILRHDELLLSKEMRFIVLIFLFRSIWQAALSWPGRRHLPYLCDPALWHWNYGTIQHLFTLTERTSLRSSLSLACCPTVPSFCLRVHSSYIFYKNSPAKQTNWQYDFPLYPRYPSLSHLIYLFLLWTNQVFWI